MNFSDDILRFDEKAIMNLRALYRRFGYSRYRMSRFEEYGIYAENKNFLVSDNIITFTDGGRLMALRPDVTLSIVKGTQDGPGISKLYYNENVYRPDGAGHEFKERMQAGLECIGEIDIYSMGEVLAIAALSLKTLGGNVCLDVSHMGFLGGFIESAGLAAGGEGTLLRLISEKNVPEIRAFCLSNELSRGFGEKAAELAALYGTFDETIDVLRAFSVNEKTAAALTELESVYRVVREFGAGDCIKLDFSIVNDLNYYSGIIFQGFIEGIPAKVLSGGRYDSLLRKFGKKSGAIGFAVYLDLLGRLSQGGKKPGVDVLLLYGGDEDASVAAGAAAALTADGYSVAVRRGRDGSIKHRSLMRVIDGRVETVEDD